MEDDAEKIDQGTILREHLATVPDPQLNRAFHEMLYTAVERGLLEYRPDDREITILLKIFEASRDPELEGSALLNSMRM